MKRTRPFVRERRTLEPKRCSGPRKSGATFNDYKGLVPNIGGDASRGKSDPHPTADDVARILRGRPDFPRVLWSEVI